MIDYLKKQLDEYLEFDSSLLFNNTDYLVIFGGSLRDIVSNYFNPNYNVLINDIDILCLSKSYKDIQYTLESNNYRMLDMHDPNTIINYDIKHLIFEPHTYINNSGKVIQIIRPNTLKVLELKYNTSIELSMRNNFDANLSQYLAFYTLLENVDLSSSGLFWDGERLYESIPHAFELNKNRKFYTLPNNLMANPNRLMIRKHKLLDKDWKEIYIKDVKDRFNKVANILSDLYHMQDLKNNLGFTKLLKLKHDSIESFIQSIKKYNPYDDLPF